MGKPSANDAKDKIPVASAEHLQQELRDFKTSLNVKETEHTWEAIDKATKRFTAVTRGGACKYDDVYLSGLRERDLSKAICGCIATERTQLSASALVLISAATRLGPAFAPLIAIYLPTIVKLLGRTNKLYIARATATLLAIVRNTRLASVLPYLSHGMDEKCLSYRKGCIEGVLTAMGGDDAENIGLSVDKAVVERKYLDDLEKCMRLGARDKDTDIRRMARRIWDIYRVEFPGRVQAFTAPLTPITRKNLDVQPGHIADLHSSTTSSLSKSQSSVQNSKSLAVPRDTPVFRTIPPKLPNNASEVIKQARNTKQPSTFGRDAREDVVAPDKPVRHRQPLLALLPPRAGPPIAATASTAAETVRPTHRDVRSAWLENIKPRNDNIVTNEPQTKALVMSTGASTTLARSLKTFKPSHSVASAPSGSEHASVGYVPAGEQSPMTRQPSRPVLRRPASRAALSAQHAPRAKAGRVLAPVESTSSQNLRLTEEAAAVPLPHNGPPLLPPSATIPVKRPASALSIASSSAADSLQSSTSRSQEIARPGSSTLSSSSSSHSRLSDDTDAARIQSVVSEEFKHSSLIQHFEDWDRQIVPSESVQTHVQGITFPRSTTPSENPPESWTSFRDTTNTVSLPTVASPIVQMKAFPRTETVPVAVVSMARQAARVPFRPHRPALASATSVPSTNNARRVPSSQDLRNVQDAQNTGKSNATSSNHTRVVSAPVSQFAGSTRLVASSKGMARSVSTAAPVKTTVQSSTKESMPNSLAQPSKRPALASSTDRPVSRTTSMDLNRSNSTAGVSRGSPTKSAFAPVKRNRPRVAAGSIFSRLAAPTASSAARAKSIIPRSNSSSLAKSTDSKSGSAKLSVPISASVVAPEAAVTILHDLRDKAWQEGHAKSAVLCRPAAIAFGGDALGTTEFPRFSQDQHVLEGINDVSDFTAAVSIPLPSSPSNENVGALDRHQDANQEQDALDTLSSSETARTSSVLVGSKVNRPESPSAADKLGNSASPSSAGDVQLHSSSAVENECTGQDSTSRGLQATASRPQINMEEDEGPTVQNFASAPHEMVDDSINAAEKLELSAIPAPMPTSQGPDSTLSMVYALRDSTLLMGEQEPTRMFDDLTLLQDGSSPVKAGSSQAFLTYDSTGTPRPTGSSAHTADHSTLRRPLRNESSDVPCFPVSQYHTHGHDPLIRAADNRIVETADAIKLIDSDEHAAAGLSEAEEDQAASSEEEDEDEDDVALLITRELSNSSLQELASRFEESRIMETAVGDDLHPASQPANILDGLLCQDSEGAVAVSHDDQQYAESEGHSDSGDYEDDGVDSMQSSVDDTAKAPQTSNILPLSLRRPPPPQPSVAGTVKRTHAMIPRTFPLFSKGIQQLILGDQSDDFGKTPTKPSRTVGDFQGRDDMYKSI